MNKICLFLKLYKNFYKSANLIQKTYLFLRILILPIDKIINEIPFKNIKNDQKIKILDIGCGYGINLITIYEYFNFKNKKNFYGLGIDINKKRICFLDNIRKNKKIKNLKFLDLNLIDNNINQKFNIVMLIDVLHHLEKKQQDIMLNKIKNLLENDGFLIIKEINDKPLFKFLFNYFHDYFVNKPPLNYLNEKELINKLVNLEFKIIKNKKIDKFNLYPHCLIIAQEKKKI